VFNAGSEPAVCPVVVVVDDPAGVVAAGCGHHGHAAVAAVTKDLAIGAEQVRRGATATMTSLRLPGQQRPATTTRRR